MDGNITAPIPQSCCSLLVLAWLKEQVLYPLTTGLGPHLSKKEEPKEDQWALQSGSLAEGLSAEEGGPPATMGRWLEEVHCRAGRQLSHQ